MTTTATLIARCRADLGLIADLIPWAHTDAFNATNAPTERRIPVGKLTADLAALEDELPDPAPTRAVEPEDPDHIPGARHDLGIGSHTSRRAYETAVTHINAAELAIATAWWITTNRRARLQKPLATSSIRTVMTAIDHTRQRLDDLPLAPPLTVKTLIGNAANSLDLSWRALNGAFTIGAADPDTQAVADLCRICSIRPTAERSGGRCSTCKTWKDRNSYERPTKLDGVHDAVAAQERRTARGEGYGEA